MRHVQVENVFIKYNIIVISSFRYFNVVFFLPKSKSRITGGKKKDFLPIPRDKYKNKSKVYKSFSYSIIYIYLN